MLQYPAQGRDMKYIRYFSCLVSTFATLAAAATPSAFAGDTLRIAISQRGVWESAVPEIGDKAGIFKKHGIELELLYTQGGGESQPSVISGSVDVGVAL